MNRIVEISKIASKQKKFCINRFKKYHKRHNIDCKFHYYSSVEVIENSGSVMKSKKKIAYLIIFETSYKKL